LREMVAADLETNGQTRRGEPARHGDCGQTVDVECRGVNQSPACRAWRRATAPSGRSRLRRHDGLRDATLRRRDQHIDRGEDLPDLAPYDVHLVTGLSVG